MRPELEPIMQRLGYNQAWLEAGIITEDLLEQQWQVLTHSDDQNAEHYRHAAFLGYLQTVNSVSDHQLERVLALQDGDDRDLRISRITALIQSELLSDAQLESQRWREFQIPTIQKSLVRSRRRSRLERYGLTEDIFAEIQKSEDARVHEHLLARADLKREHVIWLSQFGKTKAIRNRAVQMRNSAKLR
jgi:hypothetical protein